MQAYSSNAIHTLTNEQRKALAQCLVLQARPAEILLATKYVLVGPTGELELTAEAGQDWLKLHQEGYGVDAITGAIVAQSDPFHFGFPWGDTTLNGKPTYIAGAAAAGSGTPEPFTPAQERRIREIVADVLRGTADSIESAE